MDNNIRSHCPLSIIHPESRKTEHLTMPQLICLSHWANKAQNGVISIVKNTSSDSPIWQLKKSQIFSKNAKFTLTLMSKENWIFLLQIQILHFKYVWNLHSLSLAWFFLIQDELWTIDNVV